MEIEKITDSNGNQYSVVDFQYLVIDCLGHLHTHTSKKNINIQWKVQDSHHFYSDPQLLSIVVNNLVSNSIKFHNPAQISPEIAISVDSDDERVLISVSDNGKGIPDSMQPEVFNLLTRENSEDFGSGLGLFMVKEIMDNLKGKIKLQSRVNEGTEFLLEIPNQMLLANVRTDQKVSDDLAQTT